MRHLRDTSLKNLTRGTPCSPEDHAILEAAYVHNSKPDKAERTAIANRVALGEKEIQVGPKSLPPNDCGRANWDCPDMVPKQKTE
jgi:hypothetical protein